ncbi:MAG: hypothetical protein ACOC7W_08975 [Desulfosalsimonas sp.]
MPEKPCFAATSMAFLPHRDTTAAVDAILKNFPEAPCLPVLSRSIRHMLEGLPALVFDRQKKQVRLDPSPEREKEIIEFYDNVENNNLDAFATTKKAAPGFYAMLERLRAAPPPGLKWIAYQTAGPVLMGEIIKDPDGRSAFYNETLRDILIKGVNMKARWLEREIKGRVPGAEVINGLPETTLVSFTSAGGSGSRAAIIEAIESGCRELQGLKWVHCCANIDWSLLTGSGVDVINFDAYQHLERILLHHEDFGAFLKRGGMLAWGIVPVTDESIGSVRAQDLADRLQAGIDGFAAKGMDEYGLAASSWIMPCCDANLMQIQNAEKAFEMTSEISRIMRKRYGFPDS